MPKEISKTPLLRNTYILIVIAALLGAFLALNYLVFIPRQQTEFNRKAFRVMHEEAEDFQERVKAYADYYQKRNTKKYTGFSISWDTLLHQSKDAKSYIQQVTVIDSCLNRKCENGDTCIVDFGTDSVIYTYKLKSEPGLKAQTQSDSATSKPAKNNPESKYDTNKKVYVKTIDEIIQPVQAMHRQMFDYLLLIKKVREPIVQGRRRSEKLLYKSPGLAIDNSIWIDSLMKHEAFRFASIHDMHVEGAKYKLFLLPFSFNNESFFLAGFIEDHGYKLSVTSSSSWIFLVIISLLLAIIISLPILKIFLLGKQENIMITDVRMLMVSLVVAPVFFIVALLTAKAYSVCDNVTDDMLIDLSGQVKRNFRQELDSMVKQLKVYDTNMATQKSAFFVKAKSNDTLHAIKPVDAFFYPETYKMFDNVSWVNDSGAQVIKWGLQTDSISYLNVSERDYYKFIKNKEAYKFNKDTIFIQPTLSWSSGEYSVNVSMPSHLYFEKDGKNDSTILVTLGSTMYATFKPAVPRSFNFAIVNQKGDILFHSESDRSLHENLFDECQDERVSDAIAHRDSVLISSVNIYDRDVKMLITPMKDFPLYLVSFYNKREQNFFVYHITAFTVLCISGVLISLLVFLYIYYLIGRKVTPLLFSPFLSDWMKPVERKSLYYKNLCVYFISFNVLVMLVSFVIFEFCHAHWLILDMAVLSCFLTIAGYYIIKQNFKPSLPEDGQKQLLVQWTKDYDKILISYFVVLFLLSLVIIFYTTSWWWLAIPWIFSALALFAAYKISLLSEDDMARLNLKRFPGTLSYLHRYVLAIFFSVFSISVLPSFIFFKYAYSHEKYLQIKSRQIYLAEKIVERSNYYDKYFKETKLPKYKQSADDTFINEVKYNMDHGIYAAFSTVNKVPYTDAPKAAQNVDSFYKVVTRLLFLPNDHTDFFSSTPFYKWPDKPDGDTTKFYYKQNIDAENNDAVFITTVLHNVKADLFDDFFGSFLGWTLIMFFIAFMLFYFKTIKSLTKRIFIIDFVHSNFASQSNTSWINSILANKNFSDDDLRFIISHIKKQSGGYTAEQKLSSIDLQNRKDEITIERIAEIEKKLIAQGHYAQLLRMQYILTSTYDALWDKCSEREKFILFDFALDGFTNYKNPHILYDLFRKGLLQQDVENGGIKLINYSFRNYLIGKADSAEIAKLRRILSRGGTWKLIQNVFFVLLLMIFAYLVITQQEISTRIAAIISGLVSLVPAMIKLFDRKTERVES